MILAGTKTVNTNTVIVSVFYDGLTCFKFGMEMVKISTLAWCRHIATLVFLATSSFSFILLIKTRLKVEGQILKLNPVLRIQYDKCKMQHLHQSKSILMRVSTSLWLSNMPSCHPQSLLQKLQIPFLSFFY